MNRMAGAEQSNPIARPLAYTKGITDDAERVIIETAFEKHQDVLATASWIAFDPECRQVRRRWEKNPSQRHSDNNQALLVDIDMDAWDEDNDAPYDIHGEGIVRDPNTGHIRPMASAMFTTIIHANSPRETEQAMIENARIGIPQFARVTTYCDLLAQMEANRSNALVAAENATITPDVNLMDLVRNVPDRFVTPEHRSAMLCSTDPSFESETHYQANKAINGEIHSQIISVRLNKNDQMLVRFRRGAETPDVILAPVSQMSGQLPVMIRSAKSMYAMLSRDDVSATAARDVHKLFSRLQETHAISDSYARQMGVGTYATTTRAMLDKERERQEAMQELNVQADAVKAQSQTSMPSVHTIR
jgi:hypothetical protein